MGHALWWLGESRFSVRYRERAFVLHRQDGDSIRACRTAVDLSIAYLVNLGNGPAARGWLAKAARVVESVEPNPMQGWLWLMEGFLSNEPVQAIELFRRALDFARRTDDVDLELVALSDLGVALVTSGKIESGMALLDEAMAGTLAGEYQRMDTVVFTTCNMLAACSLVGDVPRSVQWCQAADDFMEQYGSPFMFATCRAHFGGVLVERGQWQRAEEELGAALEIAEAAGPTAQAEVLARLADLRFRQGKLEEAEALLAQVPEASSAAVPAAGLALVRGRPEVAVVRLERHLDQIGDHHVRAAETMAKLVEAHLAAGDVDAAAGVATRLIETARSHDLPYPTALASVAHAHLAFAQGNPEEAREHLEKALHLFAQLDMPLDAARLRIKLAASFAVSNPSVAVVEARIALTTFEELGAELDANTAASLLRRLGAPGRTGPKRLGVLTKREREVLQLVAEGLSNPEIADRLYISRKTASHHVSSVLTKLGLRNRAEAAAYAARHAATGREKGPDP